MLHSLKKQLSVFDLHLLVGTPDVSTMKNIFAYLEPMGYQLDSAANSDEVHNCLKTSSYEAIILDAQLTDQNGIPLYTCLRISNVASPIILLTPDTTLENLPRYLNGGADDIVTSPLHLLELEARVLASIRLARAHLASTKLSWAGIELDSLAHTVTCDGKNYTAQTDAQCSQTNVAISFYFTNEELASGTQKSIALLQNTEAALQKNDDRWQTYLQKILRKDMKHEYDRVAVKSVVTLISNWRTHREGLLHEGVIPSHAVPYFIGFWAWDSWRFSAALARFAPELAKNNIRAMFDYQQPDGMIIDCIYTNSAENNARDSKPPLVCWAVDEIFTYNQDTAFVKEMYPQLLAYYKWWYQKRDHNRNGMCEFGSTDGTLEAAGWESGMDNAIRFDNAKMLKNGSDAWSLDQESVDLNAYLAYECKLLKKFAGLIGSSFDGPDYSDKVADYFFNDKIGWFCDKRIADGSFIAEPACEGYTPFWTKIASKEQMEKALVLLTDTTKFSTYIPFPTAAADNPKCDPNGYWRGPIWLDQTYQAIRGLRNYGYKELADKYTMQVFDRCQGLTGDAPIHENYGTHNGELLQASHFSWSASHLLMMYEDFGK